MYQGKLNKARRGELVVAVPVGYVKSPAGEVTLDPGGLFAWVVVGLIRLQLYQFVATTHPVAPSSSRGPLVRGFRHLDVQRG